MSAPDLALVKLHLHIDHDDDDDVLTTFLAAAESMCAVYYKREPVTAAERARFNAAVILAVGKLFKDENPFADGVLPSVMHALLSDRVPTIR